MAYLFRKGDGAYPYVTRYRGHPSQKQEKVLYMAWRWESDTGEFPTLRILAELSGMSEGAAYDHMRTLTRRGLLVKSVKGYVTTELARHQLEMLRAQ